MPRRLRSDYPGAWHHVMNRGVARRALFESREDVRRFLALLAACVRAGDIEIHSYSFLSNHFHLLVRSPRGRLSAAMQRVEDAYARRFNLQRGRDGPLFRGRFTNRVIDSSAYWVAVLAYIDRNAVEAGLAPDPYSYPHGSARHYLRRAGPPWLSRGVVEEWVAGELCHSFGPGDYPRAMAASSTPGALWLAGRRMETPASSARDPLVDLLDAPSDRVRTWLGERARLADGLAKRIPLLSPPTLTACLERARVAAPGRRLPVGGANMDGREILTTGAMREFCGLTLEEIGERLALSPSAVRRRMRTFRAALRKEDFRDSVAALLEEGLRQDHSARRVPWFETGGASAGAPEIGPGAVQAAQASAS